MNESFRITELPEGRLVRFDTSSTQRARVLYYFYALRYLLMGVAYVYIIPPLVETPDLTHFIYLGSAIVFLLAFYRFITKATEVEKLFIARDRLEVGTASLFGTKTETFELDEITELKFNQKETYEPHPLAGVTFDYLGFQTEQIVLQNLHSEGRVSFFYKGRLHRFGKDLVSWEFEELQAMLLEISGRKFIGIEEDTDAEDNAGIEDNTGIENSTDVENDTGAEDDATTEENIGDQDNTTTNKNTDAERNIGTEDNTTTEDDLDQETPG